VKPAAEVIASWANLDFDSFIERSYSEYLRRFPEWLTSLGLSGAFGVRNDALNDYSEGYLEETEALEQAVLERFRGYDRASLSSAQQVTYDIFEWCFDDRVHGQEFALYDYPISHYTITSLHWAVFDLLTDTQPIASLEDAEDYVSRLLRVGRQFDQVIDGLRRRADAGIVVPKSVMALARPEIDRLAGAPASQHPESGQDHLRAVHRDAPLDLGHVVGGVPAQDGTSLGQELGALQWHGRLRAARRVVGLNTGVARDEQEVIAHLGRHATQALDHRKP
jgi:uncharacterized protein (DUF885 family)